MGRNTKSQHEYLKILEPLENEKGLSPVEIIAIRDISIAAFQTRLSSSNLVLPNVRPNQESFLKSVPAKVRIKFHKAELEAPKLVTATRTIKKYFKCTTSDLIHISPITEWLSYSTYIALRDLVKDLEEESKQVSWKEFRSELMKQRELRQMDVGNRWHDAQRILPSDVEKVASTKWKMEAWKSPSGRKRTFGEVLESDDEEDNRRITRNLSRAKTAEASIDVSKNSTTPIQPRLSRQSSDGDSSDGDSGDGNTSDGNTSDGNSSDGENSDSEAISIADDDQRSLPDPELDLTNLDNLQDLQNVANLALGIKSSEALSTDRANGILTPADSQADKEPQQVPRASIFTKDFVDKVMRKLTARTKYTYLDGSEAYMSSPEAFEKQYGSPQAFLVASRCFVSLDVKKRKAWVWYLDGVKDKDKLRQISPLDHDWGWKFETRPFKSTPVHDEDDERGLAVGIALNHLIRVRHNMVDINVLQYIFSGLEKADPEKFWTTNPYYAKSRLKRLRKASDYCTELCAKVHQLMAIKPYLSFRALLRSQLNFTHTPTVTEWGSIASLYEMSAFSLDLQRTMERCQTNLRAFIMEET